MQLNLGKTKIIVFRNGGYLRFYEHWTYRNQPVEVVSYYKYLGLLFTPKLKWTRAKDTLVAQGSPFSRFFSIKEILAVSNTTICLRFLKRWSLLSFAMLRKYGVIHTRNILKLYMQIFAKYS